MKKTIKKLDNNVVKALTKVCERLKDKNPHFLWLTHTADYANFPNSLLVYFVFSDRNAVSEFNCSDEKDRVIKHMHSELLKAGVLLKQPKRHVFVDSEEACELEHQGDWAARIRKQ
uniref:Fis family transcriptional regulator n=1 Tax=Ningiella ruwaisensis TaxID=2364274 RepID=UPI00109F4318|nr:Fis family transcriptional regulator [Ningiella ruwaisensis]